MSERISDERLAEVLQECLDEGSVDYVARRYGAVLPARELLSMLRELKQRRSGQWICPGCGLRQERKQEDAGF